MRLPKGAVSAPSKGLVRCRIDKVATASSKILDLGTSSSRKFIVELPAVRQQHQPASFDQCRASTRCFWRPTQALAVQHGLSASDQSCASTVISLVTAQQRIGLHYALNGHRWVVDELYTPWHPRSLHAHAISHRLTFRYFCRMLAQCPRVRPPHQQHQGCYPQMSPKQHVHRVLTGVKICRLGYCSGISHLDSLQTSGQSFPFNRVRVCVPCVQAVFAPSMPLVSFNSSRQPQGPAWIVPR